MIHELKIREQFYRALISGNKNFEVRKNDRNFKVGDYLALNEVDDTGSVTDDSIIVKVTYILDDPTFCKDGYVIMGIKYINYFGKHEVKEGNNG